MGRPSTYDPDVAQRVCERLASGESLMSICRDAHMPAEATVRLWALDNRGGFAADYARARDLQAQALVESIDDIAATATADNWQQARLLVDTRKWIASKILPKQYGDKVETTLQGPGGAPLVPTLSVTVKRE